MYPKIPNSNRISAYDIHNISVLYGVRAAEVDGGCSGVPDAVPPRATASAATPAAASAALPPGAGAHHVSPLALGPLYPG